MTETVPPLDPDDDYLDWGEDPPSEPEIGPIAPPWLILVVDDDADVREATRYALSSTLVFDRPLQLIFADSAKAGWEAIEARNDICVAVVDVVMETPEAGLDLAARIRADDRFAAMRIILRTGQPGRVPEAEVIAKYDINDYKTKSELTQGRLVSSLTAALRAYSQIQRLERSQRGLAGAARGAAALMEAVSGEAELGRAASALARDLFGPGARLAIVESAAGASARFSLLDEGLRAGAGLSEPMQAAQVERAARLSHASGAIGASEIGAPLGSAEQGAHLWLELSEPLDEVGLAVLSVFVATLGSALSVTKMREGMRAAAYEDRLTGLPNRPSLMMEIDSMPAADRAGRCLLFIDIEGFSGVNDALGYDAGDALLIALTRMLRERYPAARLFRMPGGAFALIGERGAMDHMLALALFEEPIEAGDWEFPVKATMGMSYLDAAKSARQTLNESNMALNSAKKAGVSFLEHDSRITQRGQELLKTTRDLKRALSSGVGLKLFYQPQMRMSDGALVGVEALCRWILPDGQMIPPSCFIPVAEATGLIMPLGRWALFEAGRQCAAWEARGAPTQVGVNVAPAQLMDPRFCAQLRQMLAETGASARLIEIEITETAAMLDPREVSATLKEARDLGFKVSIDDFGSGYSSLAQLERMPIDRLKMDRAFVFPLALGHRSLNIARMVAKLALELGMDVIAEGVETEEQAVLLQSVGVTQAQGWLYAPAMAPEEFDRWLVDRQLPAKPIAL